MKTTLILKFKILFKIKTKPYIHVLKEEVFRSAKRKQDKKSRKKKSNIDDDEFEEQLQENLKVIPRPQLKVNSVLFELLDIICYHRVFAYSNLLLAN